MLIDFFSAVVNFGKNNFLAAYSLQPDNPLRERLQEMTSKCVKALGDTPCFPFHTEIWHTPEDELVFCEIGSRTGGGEIGMQFVELFGFNLDKSSIQVP